MRTKEQQYLFEKGLKRCCVCGQIFPRSHFPRSNERGRCLECQQDYDKQRHKKEYRKLVLEGGARLIQKREYAKRYYAEHKDMYRKHHKAYLERQKTNEVQS